MGCCFDVGGEGRRECWGWEEGGECLVLVGVMGVCWRGDEVVSDGGRLSGGG